MLGGNCSQCCGCSTDDRYAIWQRLLSSQCAVSVETSCKRQHAATHIQPGFAAGDSDVRGKYFPPKVAVWSAQRFFFRPAPDFNGTYNLSVDLLRSNQLSTWISDGTAIVNGYGVVQWRHESADIDINVTAYVGNYTPYGVLPDAAGGDLSRIDVMDGRCKVQYTVSATLFTYQLNTRDADYDPAAFASTAYSGTIPPISSSSGTGTFTKHLATASPPIISVNDYSNSLETGFWIGPSPGPEESIFPNNRELSAWWQEFLITLSEQQLKSLNSGGSGTQLPSFGIGDHVLATQREVFCVPAEVQPENTIAITTGQVTNEYKFSVHQWVDNTSANWIQQPTFNTFWNWSWGGRMSVQGSLSPQKYARLPDTNFTSTFSATITHD